MKLIYGYMNDDTLRHELNELTRKTFWFDFENWVTGGYYEGDYIPYSYEEDGKIISNVSVNRMDFVQNGVTRHYIQLGTVMTDEAYRKQGLARRLMEHVLNEYEGKCDGIYLFGNLDALDFYRKTGFKECMQYRYTLKKGCVSKVQGHPFNKIDKNMKNQYMDYVRNSAVNSALEQINKFGLQMFYTAEPDNIYYSDELDCFAVIESDNGTVMLQSIICKDKVSLKDVIARIDMDYENMVLGFAPDKEYEDMFESRIYDGADDYRLFYRGESLKSIEEEKLYFPELSHA